MIWPAKDVLQFNKNKVPQEKLQNTKKESFNLPSEITPRKTHMSPENQWLEDICPIEIVPF